MAWLPLVVSFAVAAALARPVLAALVGAGIVRENYRGTVLPAASGVVIVVAALVSLAPLAALDELAGAGILGEDLGLVLLYTLGVAVLGLIDDMAGGRAPAGAESGAEAPRGFRGHGQAALQGRLSTGTLKAVGVLGLALYVMAGRGRPAGEYLLAVAVLVLATNVLNLLDLRPGRAAKALVLLGAALTVGVWDTGHLQALGLLLGAVLVVTLYDLREEALLGDVGSNVLGALAGLWLVLALSATGQAAALAVLAAVTAYGEFRSISALVERNPLLRALDSLGRKA